MHVALDGGAFTRMMSMLPDAGSKQRFRESTSKSFKVCFTLPAISLTSRICRALSDCTGSVVAQVKELQYNVIPARVPALQPL